VRCGEKKEDSELEHNPMARKLFREIVDDEHGVYFQDVEMEEKFWELLEEGDEVVNDDELQDNPMKIIFNGKMSMVNMVFCFQDVDMTKRRRRRSCIP
jgi:hypothetical protein